MNAISFLKEVKSELYKITWPSKRETLGAGMLVFATSFIAALFFMLVDGLIYKLVHYFLGFGG